MPSSNTRVAAALCLSSWVSVGSVAQEQVPIDSAAGKKAPRSVILIVGDGMDDHQVTIARNYLKGADGRLLLDEMPLRAAVQILTTEDRVDGKPIYVADSANTATSMATGAVTSRGRLATSPGDDLDLPTIVEMASTAGYRTGIVTTASVTDATPSAFVAHIDFRLCENPELIMNVTYSGVDLGGCQGDLKANGGLGSISEQLADSDVDVILGGGTEHFELAAESSGETVLQQARAQGFQTVSSLAELQAATTARRLLGLFSPDTMPVRLRGEDGRKAEEIERSWLNYLHPYLGEATPPEPMHCEPNPDFEGMPTLKDMTDSAIAHLSAGNDRGFFLMIESASIDKQAHERNPCGSIGELQQLEEALSSALAFAQQHPRTLVLVTADHTQAAQLIPNESLFGDFPIPIYSPGKVARVITPEGAIMAVNYATTTFIKEEHTGANVPLYGNRESVGLVPPFIQQPQLFDIAKRYLGL